MRTGITMPDGPLWHQIGRNAGFRAGSMRNASKYIENFFSEETGQGINEYAAVMAFVSLVFLLVFVLTQGQLAQSLADCFSGTAGQMNRLSNYNYTT